MNKIEQLELQRKTADIRAAISPEAKKLIIAAAKKLDINLSAYIRQQLYILIREIPTAASKARLSDFFGQE